MNTSRKLEVSEQTLITIAKSEDEAYYSAIRISQTLTSNLKDHPDYCEVMRLLKHIMSNAIRNYDMICNILCIPEILEKGVEDAI